MNKIVLRPNANKKFSLHCPFTNEKLFNNDNSYEIYEGAGNYLFSMCDDCMFFDTGNNDEIESYWENSSLEAIEKFVENHSSENILVIEIEDKDEKYYYGFINEENTELSKEEIENRFIK